MKYVRKQFRIPNAQDVALTKEAKRRDVSESQIIRDMLTRYLHV